METSNIDKMPETPTTKIEKIITSLFEVQL